MISVFEATIADFPDWSREARRDPWGIGKDKTIAHLEDELAHLGADRSSQVNLGLLVKTTDFRRDGWPMARVVIPAPVLIEVPESAHGRLRYVSTTYDNWVANLHAVGLTLERLRAVTRYGCAGAGEQYSGWKALPAGPQAELLPHQVARNAAVVLRGYMKDPEAWPVERIVAEAGDAWAVVLLTVHPDRNDGSMFHWRAAADAAQILGVTS